MSVLLTVPLGPHPPVPGGPDDKSPYALRVLASSVLKWITEQYAPQYPGLLPRGCFNFMNGSSCHKISPWFTADIQVSRRPLRKPCFHHPRQYLRLMVPSLQLVDMKVPFSV